MYFISMFTAIVFIMCLSKILFELAEMVVNEDNKLMAVRAYLINNEQTLLGIAVSGATCFIALAFIANRQGSNMIDVLIR